jgi:hypothetical protein
VRPLAERMVELARRAAMQTEEQRDVERIVSRNGSRTGLPERGSGGPEPVKELQQCLVELGSLGVEVKDIGSGLLDFPAVRQGEEVLLCWRIGEPAVSWWHRREDGFAGRQPIDWGAELEADA